MLEPYYKAFCDNCEYWLSDELQFGICNRPNGTKEMTPAKGYCWKHRQKETNENE